MTVLSIGLVLCELAMGWLLIVVLIRASRRIGRRTQRPTSSVANAIGLLTLGFMTVIAVGLYAIPALRAWLNRPSDVGIVGIFGLLLALWGFAELMALLVIARSLPPARRFAGPQRSRAPYRAMIVVAQLGTAAIPVVMWLLFDWSAALKALAAFGTLTAYLRYRQARARPMDADEELKQDPRLLVLYLRPFEEDVELFAVRAMTWRQAFSAYLNLSSSELSSRYFQTVEEFFADAVRAQLGPFVALGNPSDRLAPQGASRIYLTDASWQDTFVALLAETRCALATCRLTPSTAWEIATLRRLGLLDRLFLVTPPPLSESRHRRVRGAMQRALLAGTIEKIVNVRRQPWPTIVADYAELGLVLPAEDPGPGAVLGFTAAGRATILSADAQVPEQYVEAIHESPRLRRPDRLHP